MRYQSPIFLLLVCCFTIFMLACGGGDGPPGGGGGGGVFVRVDVVPLNVGVALGASYQFTATVVNSANQQVTWDVQGIPGQGTVDSTGLYQAPSAMPGTGALVKVRATAVVDPTQFGEANINLYFAPPPGQFPIDLNVASRTGWLSTAVPVTSGVPMSKGLCSSENVLRVQTGAGVDVPAQFRVLSRWSDNSIRWVLVDFLANTTTGGVYRLNTGGSGSATGTNMSVINGASSITVSTGALTFTVSKTAFRLFESVLIDRDGAGGVNDECLDTAALRGVVVNDLGTDYLMNQITPDSITVEEQGPLRTCIRVEGRHRNTPGGSDKLRYIVRIHAYNDQPFVRVVYSYKNMQNHSATNSGAASEAAQLASYVQADSIALQLPMNFGGSPICMFVGDSGTHQNTLTAAQTATQFQNYLGGYDVTDSENQPQPGAYVAGTGDGSGDTLTNVWPTQADNQIGYSMSGGVITGTGGKAPGAMQMAFGASGNNLRVTAAMRNFWQEYPHALTAQGNGVLKMEFWPSLAWKLQVFEGVMKTHEAALSFERQAGVLSGTASTLANFLNDPPFAACTPSHYRASQAFGHIGRTNATFTSVSAFNAGYQAYITPYLAELSRHFTDLFSDLTDGNGSAIGHQYGYWNFGDAKNIDGSGAWDNQDYGIGRACFSWFAASAAREMLYLGDMTSRHFRDINVIHSDVGRRYNYSEPGNPAVFTYGAAQQTSQRGKSRFTPNNKQHDMGNFHFGAHNFESLKGEFLGDHYLLYGDGLSLDVLAEAYSYVRGTWKRHFDANYGGADNTATCPTVWFANALFVATSYYVCTGSADAKTMAQYILARIRVRQTNVEPNDPNGQGFADNTGSFQAWMLGHLTQALEWYRWVMEDSSVDSNLETCMNWALGTNAKVYLGNLATPIPGAFAEYPNGTTDFGSVNLMLGAGYTGALRSSNDAQWRVRCSNLLTRQTTDLQAQTDAGIGHRTFAQRFRAGPSMLACFE